MSLYTIEEFSAAISGRPGDLVEQVFEHLFETRIKPVFAGTITMIPEEQVLRKACHRYMMGQLGLMAEFDFIPDSRRYTEGIINYLTACGPSMTLEDVDRVRGFYEQFVDLLCDRSLITCDDVHTYKEVYPLYPPFFVYYDEEPEFYRELADVAKDVFGDEIT